MQVRKTSVITPRVGTTRSYTCSIYSVGARYSMFSRKLKKNAPTKWRLQAWNAATRGFLT